MFDSTTYLCELAPFVCKEFLRLTADLMPGVDNLERGPYFTNHFPCGKTLIT